MAEWGGVPGTGPGLNLVLSVGRSISSNLKRQMNGAKPIQTHELKQPEHLHYISGPERLNDTGNGF